MWGKTGGVKLELEWEMRFLYESFLKRPSD